jgi:hypothetical protein
MRDVVAALFFLALTSAAAAQVDAATTERLSRQALAEQLGTISVTTIPQFSQGELWSCAVDYNVLARDWVYRQGGFITVSGGFGVMQVKKRLAGYLKVVLHDIDPRTMAFTPSRPASAYFVTSDLSTSRNSVIDTSPSDVPGGIFVVLHAEPTLRLIVNGFVNDKVVVAFNRRQNGIDIQVPIDTSIEDTAPDGKQRKRSPKAALEFSNCVEQLIKNIEQLIKNMR